jgi:Family of unknown function (DUF5320)
MPRVDGTGSQGAGPMTGRGMGYCGNYNRGRFVDRAPGLRAEYGLGCRGRAHGWRNRFFVTGVPGWVPPTPEQEIAYLNTWADQLKTQLDVILNRIEELKS